MQYYILYRNVLDYNLNSALGNCFEITDKNTTTKTETPVMSQTPDKLHNLDIFLLQKRVYRPKIFKPLFPADNRITSGLKHSSSGLESRQVLPDQCHARITSCVAEGLGITATEIAIRNMA